MRSQATFKVAVSSGRLLRRSYSRVVLTLARPDSSSFLFSFFLMSTLALFLFFLFSLILFSLITHNWLSQIEYPELVLNLVCRRFLIRLHGALPRLLRGGVAAGLLVEEAGRGEVGLNI